MHLVVVGASGFVGTPITQEALRRGHTVTAIVRNPGKITFTDPHLTVVQGDALQVGSLIDTFKGHDAVISAYNAGWDNPHLYADFIQASKNIQESTRDAGVKRLLVVGGAGSLEIAPGVQLVDTPSFPAEYKAGATAARDYLDFLKTESALEWTFLSPAILLQPGERTGHYRVGKDNPVFNDQQESKISVPDMAVAILDTLEAHLHVRERFTVGY